MSHDCLLTFIQLPLNCISINKVFKKIITYINNTDRCHYGSTNLALKNWVFLPVDNLSNL